MKALLRFAIVLALVAASAQAAPTTVTDLLRYLPADAEVVMAVDVAALRTHPLIQTWLMEHQAGWTGIDGDLQRFLRDAGLDPLRDVDLMVVAARPSQGGRPALVLFGGRYDPQSFGAALVARGAVAQAVRGVPLYLVKDEQGDGAAVALPSADLVIAGDPTTVRAALGPARAPCLMVRASVSAGHVDPGAPFWLVALVPERIRVEAGKATVEVQGEHADTIRSVLAASGTVQRVALQARLDRELVLSGAALTDTAENGELLRDTVKGVLAAARLQLQSSEPDLVDVLRGAEVRVKGNEVSGQMAIPLPLVEKLSRQHDHSTPAAK